LSPSLCSYLPEVSNGDRFRPYLSVCLFRMWASPSHHSNSESTSWNLLGMDQCVRTVATAVSYATARQAQQSATMWTSGNALRKRGRVKLALPRFLAGWRKRTRPELNLGDGSYQLLVPFTSRPLCFRRFHQLMHRPSNVRRPTLAVPDWKGKELFRTSPGQCLGCLSLRSVRDYCAWDS